MYPTFVSFVQVLHQHVFQNVGPPPLTISAMLCILKHVFFLTKGRLFETSDVSVRELVHDSGYVILV